MILAAITEPLNYVAGVEIFHFKNLEISEINIFLNEIANFQAKNEKGNSETVVFRTNETALVHDTAYSKGIRNTTVINSNKIGKKLNLYNVSTAVVYNINVKDVNTYFTITVDDIFVLDWNSDIATISAVNTDIQAVKVDNTAEVMVN